MTVQPAGDRPDPDVSGVYRALEAYSRDHPLAEVGVFRRDADRLSVRIIDPDFQGQSLRQRNDRVWTLMRAALGASADRVSVLLLMTPQEAAESYVSSVEVDESSEGPIQFLRDTYVFRERVAGQDVYVTVGRPSSANGFPADGYGAWFKFGFPPGIVAADDYGLSIDTGELLRNADHSPHRFESAETARAAAVEAAKARLSRLAAA